MQGPSRTQLLHPPTHLPTHPQTQTFTDCFNCLPVAAVIDEKIFCMHGGLSPDLNSLEEIKDVMRPTDVPDTGLLCDLLWADPVRLFLSTHPPPMHAARFQTSAQNIAPATPLIHPRLPQLY